ncbi:MAG: hypothetical protein ACLT33_06940 [Lachnospira pectinoschiza]
MSQSLYDIKIVASRKKKHISRKVAVEVMILSTCYQSSGDTEITLEAGSNYESRIFAVDNYDGDITDKVETSAVDIYNRGYYNCIFS